MKVFLLTAAAWLVTCGAATAQTAEELRTQLNGQSGVQRVRTLAALTDALRQDRPEEAIAYGNEALTLLATYPDAPSEVRTLNELAWAYMTLSDYTNGVALAEKGRARAEAARIPHGRARAVNNLGVIAQRRGDALRAVEHFTEALAAYRELRSDLDISMALNNLGFVYSTALADYETALTYHVEALAVRERLDDKAAVALSLNNIGIVYHRVGDPDRALAHFERALAIRREIGGANRIASTLHNIGDVYADQKDYQRALATHTEAMTIRRAIGDRAGLAHSLRNIGVVHDALGNHALARRTLAEALAMATTSGDQTIVVQAKLGLALVERQRGSATLAVTHAREALALSEELNNLELTRRAWEQLSLSQEQARDFAGALESYRSFHDVNTRIFNAERSRRVELLDRKYEAEHRQAELAALRAQQASAALRLTQQNTLRNALIAGGAVFGCIGFGLYRRRVESARLAERLSVTDTLTGLKNRRYVLQTIDADVGVCTRKYRVIAGQPVPANSDLIFMLIDIDNFKTVNDQYGHAAGDRVLAQMADVLRSTCRTSDTVVRWGGEEFLVIFRFGNRDTAPISAERIRMAVEQHIFNLGDGRTIGRTCSIGFAAFPHCPKRPDEVSWEQVVALADDALYEAKQAGRNTWAGGDPARLNLAS